MGATWRAKQSHSATLPADFETVLATVSHFADPVFAGGVADLSWDPLQRLWT